MSLASALETLITQQAMSKPTIGNRKNFLLTVAVSEPFAFKFCWLPTYDCSSSIEKDDMIAASA